MSTQLAQAETAGGAPAAPRFRVERYVVTGNTLLAPALIDRTLRAFVGEGKDFGDVQRALEALQSLYGDAGYSTVGVMLPEQELERGEVRFQVIETRVGKVTVEGNERYFSTENIRASLPHLREGTIPNSRDLAQNLRAANESPAKDLQLMLRASEKEGEVDAWVKVAEENPLKLSVSLDNTGAQNTGHFRLGLGFQHANVWDRDHQVNVQVITSPEKNKYEHVKIFGMGYKIPLFAWGDSIDLVAGYSNVNSGTVQNLFNVTGAGTVFAVRYNLGLPQLDRYEHKLIAGYDLKMFTNQVTSVGGTENLVPDINLNPVSLTYTGLWRGPTTEFGFYGSFAGNYFNGGSDQEDETFDQIRRGARPTYFIYRAGGTLNHAFESDWQVRVNASAQYTEHLLVAQEQIGFGGMYNVRGFAERQYSNDKGVWSNWELYTPDLAGKFGWDGWRVRLLAFYDTALAKRTDPVPPEMPKFGLDSAGFGVRATFRNNVSIRIDGVKVLHDGGQSNGQLDGRTGVTRLHASVVLVF